MTVAVGTDRSREWTARATVIAQRLKERYGAERVLLFGSVARGEATEHSDVDMLIVAPTREGYYARLEAVRSIADDLQPGLPLSPIVLTREELEERLALGDQFYNEILRSGRDLLPLDESRWRLPVNQPPAQRYIDEWREYARDDWRRMLLHLGVSDAPAAGQFLQQSMEKFLKGYLISRGWQLQRVHELKDLLDDALAYDASLAQYRPLCVRVTPYYLADRYPRSQHRAPSEAQVRSDAREAVTMINRLFPDESLQAP